MLGRQVSHYRILELIGEGGMGAVYRAEDLTLGRVVAVKVLTKSQRDSENANRLFLREAQAVSRIDHPNVVTLFEVLQEEDATFLVMQFLDGASLRNHLAGGPLEMIEALRIACEAGAGLQAAHRIGVVHRDLKPENVMLSRAGTCKILDFGVARLADRSTLRDSTGLCGTVPYMAPEQVRGGAVDARADVYGLGVLLYEMLAGRPAFAGVEEVALLYEVVNCDPPPLDRLRPGLPEGLMRIVAQALAKNPDQRYADIDSMLHDLEIVRAAHAAPVSHRDRLFAKVMRRGWGRAAIAGPALALLMGLSYWGVSRMLVPRGPPRVMVMKWEIATSVRGEEWLSSGIMDCLIRVLSGHGGFHVISRQTVTATVQSMGVPGAGRGGDKAIGAADRVGAAFLVSGSIEPLADRLQVSCELVDVRKGIVVRAWTRDLRNDRTEFHPMIDEFAAGISGEMDRLSRRPGRAGVGESRPVGRPVAELLTPSIEALKFYQMAMEKREAGDFAGALRNLERALDFDSTFTEAHLLIARMTPEAATYKRRLELAMKHRHRASAKTRLLVEAADFASRREYEPTRQKYQEILALDPEDVIARSSLARLYVHRRRFEDAVAEYAVLHHLNPFDYSYYAWWAAAYIETGRVDKALGILEDWRHRFPREESPIVESIGTLQMLGRYHRALTLCDTLDALRPGAGDMHRGFLLVDLGRVREAGRAFERVRMSPDPSRPASRAESYLALVAHRRKDYTRGLSLIESALRAQPDTYNYWVAGLLAAGAGDVERAEACARQIAARFDVPEEDSTTAEAFGNRRFYFHLLGVARQSGGDPAAAVAMFSRALRYSGRADDSYFRTYLGSALLDAGDAARSAEELRRVLDFNPYYPEALLYLGRACVRQRQYEQARRPLQTLKSVWKEADADDPLNLELAGLLVAASPR